LRNIFYLSLLLVSCPFTWGIVLPVKAERAALCASSLLGPVRVLLRSSSKTNCPPVKPRPALDIWSQPGEHLSQDVHSDLGPCQPFQKLLQASPLSWCLPSHEHPKQSCHSGTTHVPETAATLCHTVSLGSSLRTCSMPLT